MQFRVEIILVSSIDHKKFYFNSNIDIICEDVARCQANIEIDYS